MYIPTTNTHTSYMSVIKLSVLSVVAEGGQESSNDQQLCHVHCYCWHLQ